MHEEIPNRSTAISRSIQKLQKATSQGRFRIKSLRVKTHENQFNQNEKQPTEKNYEQKLINYGFRKQFLKNLYTLRSQQSQLKVSDQKYQAFIKSIYQKIHKTNTLEFSGFNFQNRSLTMFLKQFFKINNRNHKLFLKDPQIDITPIISYDFTNCSYLSTKDYSSAHTPHIEQKLQTFMLTKCLSSDLNIVKILLRNLSLDHEQIQQIFGVILNKKKIFELDLSNQSSQSMNRFGSNLEIIESFFRVNKTVAIIKLNNLALKKHGVDCIYRGISDNLTSNPIKILCLKNNGINEHSANSISAIVKSGIISLDLSENPLSPAFFLGLPSWKPSTLSYLDISMTDMDSESFIFFLSRIQQNKALQTLIADQNNLSNDWFNQTKEMLEANTSIQKLSLIDCKITRLCETFKGLYHNRYLKKLILSQNQFEQGVIELTDLIKNNRVITQIRLKFCGIREVDLFKVIGSLAANDTLTILDISQNFLGEEGGRQILKMLNKNKTLSSLVLDKMQMSMRMKKDIDEKITANKALKKQKKFNSLKKQNKIYKNLDVGTWEDVEKMYKRVQINEENIKLLNGRVQVLEKETEKKKHHFYEITKQYRQRQSQLINKIDELDRNLKNLDSQEKQIVMKFQQSIQEAHDMKNKEQESIAELQYQIKEESKKNRNRENELEDIYQNKKYMKKKQETVGKKSSVTKLGFDTTTALNSKRKSKNY